MLTSGTGTVVWTADFDGNVRFYTHRDAFCGWEGEGDGSSRVVQCGTPPPAPENCTEHFVLSNNFENGLFLGGDDNQKGAVDIPVGEQGFTLYGFAPNLVGEAEATEINFVLYNDADGLPGTEIQQINGIIKGSELTFSEDGWNVYKYTVAFENPVNLNANTTYWIEVVTDAEGWEATGISLIGSYAAFKNDGTGGEWESAGVGAEFVYQLLCEDVMSAHEVHNKQISYHPNPVKISLPLIPKKISAAFLFIIPVVRL